MVDRAVALITVLRLLVNLGPGLVLAHTYIVQISYLRDSVITRCGQYILSGVPRSTVDLAFVQEGGLGGHGVSLVEDDNVRRVR